MRLGEARLESERAVVGVERLAGSPHVPQHVGAVEVGQRIGGAQRYRPVQRDQRLAEPAEFLQGDAAIAVGFRKLRGDGERGIEGGKRRLRLAAPQEGVAEDILASRMAKRGTVFLHLADCGPEPACRHMASGSLEHRLDRLVSAPSLCLPDHRSCLTPRSATTPAIKKASRIEMPIRWLPDTIVNALTASGPRKLVTLPERA